MALDVPLRRLFDYVSPASTPVMPGCRVRVPFGRRSLVGLVIDTPETSEVPPDRLKPATEVLDAQPVLDASALGLLSWAADYYHHPIGEVLASALPKGLRAGAPAVRTVRRWHLSASGQEILGQGGPSRAPAQRQLLQHLLPDALDETTLEQHMPRWREAARAAATRGWVEYRDEVPAAPDSVAAPVVEDALAPTPSAEQAAAVAAVTAGLGRFGAFVLHGMTGSGKTEVYLRLIRAVLERGQRALVLVPEIGLTPQLVARFEQRLAVPLAVLHSGLTDSARLEAWRAAASGRARIVLGTRSAVFAPVPDLGLVVVDEEHDSSFKQHEGGFHYSARDLALVRAQRAGVPVMLGSATPSLETLQNIADGRYVRLSLPRRAAAQAQPPRLSLVDLRAHAVTGGLSTPVLMAMERHLAEDGQVLVFLNRRGYAPSLLCSACGWIAPCASCDARMTVHRASKRLSCHHCGAGSALPENCPRCGFATRPVGQGTERIEERLAEQFPKAPLVRVDRDVVRGQQDMEAAMRAVNEGQARILVGTQMVTKGHDFQNMTLVVVLNADQGLFGTDFRAAERLAQTLVQVAGRAGRGGRPGEVLIQTEYPEHPLLQTLLKEGYEGFAQAALAERRQAHWPPFSRLAVIRASALSAPDALAFLNDARREAGRPQRVQLQGPVPAAMSKRADRYHAQLLVESVDRGALHGFLDGWLEKLAALPSARRVRWALDVDPIELF